MADKSIEHIAILGAGFAGAMTAAALKALLPQDIKLTLVDIPGADKTDALFGTVTSPTGHDFLLGIGITEPDLLPNTNTAFSLGTHYDNWGVEKRGWTQTFHQSLPLLEAVDFQHYLTRLRSTHPQLCGLQPYVMSIHAARRGVFAHPPDGQRTPLSDIGYGYQFLPKQWRDFFLSKVKENNAEYVKADIAKIAWKDAVIESITLSNGDTLKAGFYIDCRGQSATADLKKKSRKISRPISATESFVPTEKLGPVCRKLSGTTSAWVAQTPLQDGLHVLNVTQGVVSDSAVEAIAGYIDEPWSSNVLTLGHGAALLAPLTPAPVMTLQRDIERLTELIPLSTDMRVEAREYNRRFDEDYRHACIFHEAFNEVSNFDDERLAAKITQFESRGICVQYDLEPFLAFDWLQLHYGMGRQPERYDPLADRLDEKRLIQTLQNMRMANEAMAAKMPPHHIYMDGLLKYLRRQNV